MVLKLRLILTSLLFFTVVSALGQISFESEEELVKAANSYFDSKDYEKAKPLFSQLLSKDAMNPDYNYRFGVCILYTESDPLKPLPYIEGGASSSGVNIEAYYFLGKAYQYNYRFDDAITHFEKGKKAGYNAPDVDLEKCIDECRNGKILYNSAIDFEPALDKEVIAAEFYRPYDFRKLKGKVIPMPPNFKTKYDEKNLKGTVVYTPSNSTTLVYASYGEDGANGKDLYRVNRLPNGEWALPQRLPNSINTKYDEDYAFFDEETNMLFFASKGHNTMGGYDVFSSEFNPSNNSWSVPVNLQYPINSPFDDFLYVSDPEGKVAFFTSRRATEAGKLRVFKTLLYDPAQVELSVVEGTYEDKTDSIFNYMVATVLDPKTNQVIGKYRSQRESGKYVLILPPQNDYVMDVGPKEADGFKFDLDVPQTEEQKPLQQSVVYDASNGQGVVTLTNYFDATGNPDSIAFAESRSQSEVEEKMVAMPDASEILAARKAQQDKKQAEELALLEEAAAAEAAILAEEKTKEEAAKKAEEERIRKEKEELAKAEKEAAEKAQAKEREEKLALLRERQRVEKLRLDSIAQAQELAAFARIERETFVADSTAKAEELARSIALEEARVDSLERVAEKVRQDSIAEVERLAMEIAEEAVAALASEREKAVEDSVANAEKQAQLVAQERERAIADSLAKSEQIALQEAAAQATEDSLLAVKTKREADSLRLIEELALAEQQRLEQIEREVEEAKAKALRDSSLVKDVVAEEGSEKPMSLFEEMAAKEAEILAQQQKEAEVAQVEESEEVKVSEEQLATEEEESEFISEADLFLQTIAELEAQKKKQEAAVVAENQKIAAERKAAEKQPSTADLNRESVVGGEELSTVGADSVKTSVKPVAEEVPVSEETSVALKSDANPDEYLAALAEIEKEIAKDNASSTKSYELQELKKQDRVGSEQTDPVLQATLDEDRKALEEHQKIAAEKEQALRNQMAKDKLVVKSVAENDLKEVDEIEKELLEGLAQKEVNATDVVEEATEVEPVERDEVKVEQPTQPVEEIDESLIAEADAALEEIVEEVSEVQEDEMPIEEPVDITDEVVEVEAEEVVAVTEKVDETVEVIAEDVEAIEETETTPELKEETAEVVEEVEDVIAEADDLMDKVVEEQPVSEPEPAKEEVALEEEVQIDEAPKSQSVVATQEPYSGEVALRDYSKRQTDFSKIENPTMKRMVKRMRAEDIGRMAVLKNMKNQWVESGKTQEALAEIKANERNQDVLANLPQTQAREEVLKNPFSKDDLRTREGVYYKLDLRLKPANVSETVSEAMNAEQAVTFAMPDFQLSTGYFTNYADAQAEMRLYASRGFDAVQVVAYLNGEPVLLSDVQNIPFID